MATPAFAGNLTETTPAGDSKSTSIHTAQPTEPAVPAPAKAATPAPVSTPDPAPADDKENETSGPPAGERTVKKPANTEPAETGSAAEAPSLEEEIGEHGSFMGQSVFAQQQQMDVQDLEQSGVMQARALEPMAGEWIAPGINGLDVSGWQPNVNWAEQWDMGARFAYVKATEGGSFKSDTFGRQYTGAYQAGMIRGAYHFALPQRGNAASQARFFVNNGGGWSADGKTLPPLLDIEHNPYSSLGNMCYDMTAGQLITWLENFSDEVKSKTGREPMIYTSYAWWTTCTNNSTALSDHALHAAAYPYPGYEDGFNVLMFGGWRDYTVWQYSSTGPFAGDSNRWNGSYRELQAFAKGSSDDNSTAPEPAPEPEPEPEPAPEPEPELDNTLMAVAPGDMDADGDADLLSRRANGQLWYHAGNGSGGYAAPRQVGTGWDIFDEITGVGDFNNDGIGDLLARKPDGTLWFYAGNGEVANSDRAYHSGVKIGLSGWSQFSQLVGSPDLTGDGINDLLATRSDGTVYIYAGKGNGDRGDRTRVTTGWDGFDHIVATGDFNDDPNADLLARKADGTLWFIEGNGRGGFHEAERLGNSTGWSQYARILGIGDNNGDRLPDFLGVGNDGTLTFYAGTGMNGRDGYKPRTNMGSSIWNTYNEIVTPGDFNGDDIADIIARKPDGSLWLLAGDGQTGHTAPRQIGTGWDMHNKIIGAGDYDGNGTNDLIARHKNGSLWFYGGTAIVDNTHNGLEPRDKIGTSGWNQFVEILGIGDFDGNGHNDLLGFREDGTLRFYSGDGTGKNTGQRSSMATGWDMYDKYITPGDFNGDNKNDIIAVAPDGTLWFYEGTGYVTNDHNGYHSRQRIGTGGWTTYRHILGIGDFNTDNNNDLIGIDHNGRAWFYEGTQMKDSGYQPNQSAGNLN